MKGFILTLSALTLSACVDNSLDFVDDVRDGPQTVAPHTIISE